MSTAPSELSVIRSKINEASICAKISDLGQMSDQVATALATGLPARMAHVSRHLTIQFLARIVEIMAFGFAVDGGADGGF